MIKFKAGDKENPIIGFGLSRRNIARLMKGDPIRIDLAEMGMAGTVLIFYGTDEQVMSDQLMDQGWITEATIIHNPKGSKPKRQ